MRNPLFTILVLHMSNVFEMRHLLQAGHSLVRQLCLKQIEERRYFILLQSIPLPSLSLRPIGVNGIHPLQHETPTFQAAL